MQHMELFLSFSQIIIYASLKLLMNEFLRLDTPWFWIFKNEKKKDNEILECMIHLNQL